MKRSQANGSYSHTYCDCEELHLIGKDMAKWEKQVKKGPKEDSKYINTIQPLLLPPPSQVTSNFYCECHISMKEKTTIIVITSFLNANFKDKRVVP